MAQKLYEETEGGIRFVSKRRAGEVRIPNYVYDLWLPLLGTDGIATYSLYCRLEMGGTVKKLSLRDLAKALRVGVDKLDKVNTMLQECGFIQVIKPVGQKRLMHWTTEIEVLDPPQMVSNELIDKYKSPAGYEVLTEWLVESQIGIPENLDRYSEEPKQVLHENLDGFSNIESLDIESLDRLHQQKTDYLETVVSSIGKVSEQTADDPVDQYWAYRDKFLEIYRELTGNYPGRIEKDAIIELAQAPQPDVKKWEQSIRVCGLNWTGRGSPPIARIIEVYNLGGSYEVWKQKTYGTNTQPPQPEKPKLKYVLIQKEQS